MVELELSKLETCNKGRNFKEFASENYSSLQGWPGCHRGQGAVKYGCHLPLLVHTDGGVAQNAQHHLTVLPVLHAMYRYTA